MNSFLDWVQKSPWVALIGFISALLGIISFFAWKNKTRNKLKDVDVGGDYTGGSRKGSGGKTVNDISNSKIKGNYVGGDDNR